MIFDMPRRQDAKQSLTNQQHHLFLARTSAASTSNLAPNFPQPAALELHIQPPRTQPTGPHTRSLSRPPKPPASPASHHILIAPSPAMHAAAQPSRAVLRQSRLLLRRNNPRQASTTTADAAAAKAKDTASGATSKASEGLSRVTSSAGNIAGGAVSGARNALNRIGGRTGRLVAFVDCKGRVMIHS